MADTRRQKTNERIAKMCDQIAQGLSLGGKQLRSVNRRIEARKREQFRRNRRG